MPAHPTRSGRDGYTTPIPGRPPVDGPRWRPFEESNPHRRPRDLDAYLAQFAARAERERQPER